MTRSSRRWHAAIDLDALGLGPIPSAVALAHKLTEAEGLRCLCYDRVGRVTTLLPVSEPIVIVARTSVGTAILRVASSGKVRHVADRTFPLFCAPHRELVMLRLRGIL